MGIVAVQNFTQPTIGPNYSGEGKQLRQIVSGAFGISQVLKLEIASEGEEGNNGWTPIFAIENSGNNSYLKLIDWIGGEGAKPAIPSNPYVGTTGFVAIGSAINIKGPQGNVGNTGAPGANGGPGADGKEISGVVYNEETESLEITYSDASEDIVPLNLPDPLKGWSPIFATETSGGNTYLKIIDWDGGQGTKPNLPSNAYIGATGFVAIGSATNFRGAQGQAGVGEEGPAGESGSIIFFGIGAPSESIGTIKDYYLDTDPAGVNGFYAKGSGDWVQIASLKGNAAEGQAIGLISTGDDLDDFKTYSRFYCADFNGLLNSPITDESIRGFLDVIVRSGTGIILQIIDAVGQNSWRRWSLDNGVTWTDWETGNTWGY